LGKSEDEANRGNLGGKEGGRRTILRGRTWVERKGYKEKIRGKRTKKSKRPYLQASTAVPGQTIIQIPKVDKIG